MKRVTTLLMLVAIVVMSSCSRQDDLPQTSGDVVKVILRAQSPEVQTRAASDIKRYIIEVYEGSDATTPANIFGEGENKTHHLEQPGGSFEMDLIKNTQYTFLLWADNSTPSDNANGFYKAADLSAVEMNESATTRTEAFYGASTQTVTSTSTLKVTLGHAVAKLVYNNTEEMIEKSNTLTVVYPYTATFNVGDGTITTTETTVTRTFNVGTGAVGELATDYLFAPATEAQLATLSIAINAETARDLTNVPVQANYVTNIKGEFSGLTNKDFNISASDDWDGEKEEEIVSVAYPATNTVYLGKAGTLTNELIAAAIGSGKDLKITGTMADADFYTLRDWAINGEINADANLLHKLDLSGVTGLTAIPKDAFSKTESVKSLTTVTLPSSVTTIGLSAFEECTSLSSIDLPNVTIVNRKAFQTCIELSAVNIPKATHIYDNAFAGCTALTSIDLPSATHIYSYAFTYTGLTAVTFGTPITWWGEYVFDGTNVSNIDLTLKRGQKQPGSESEGTNCTGDEVTAGEGAPFAGYTFKSITLVD